MKHRSPAVFSGGVVHELIDFTDCDGIIGPVVANKLLRDFIEYESRVNAWPNASRFRELYQCWHDAFRMAAQNGAVVFV